MSRPNTRGASQNRSLLELQQQQGKQQGKSPFPMSRQSSHNWSSLPNALGRNGKTPVAGKDFPTNFQRTDQAALMQKRYPKGHGGTRKRMRRRASMKRMKRKTNRRRR